MAQIPTQRQGLRDDRETGTIRFAKRKQEKVKIFSAQFSQPSADLWFGVAKILSSISFPHSLLRSWSVPSLPGESLRGVCCLQHTIKRTEQQNVERTRFNPNRRESVDHYLDDNGDVWTRTEAACKISAVAVGFSALILVRCDGDGVGWMYCDRAGKPL